MGFIVTNSGCGQLCRWWELLELNSAVPAGQGASLGLETSSFWKTAVPVCHATQNVTSWRVFGFRGEFISYPEKQH